MHRHRLELAPYLYLRREGYFATIPTSASTPPSFEINRAFGRSASAGRQRYITCLNFRPSASASYGSRLALKKPRDAGSPNNPRKMDVECSNDVPILLARVLLAPSRPRARPFLSSCSRARKTLESLGIPPGNGEGGGDSCHALYETLFPANLRHVAIATPERIAKELAECECVGQLRVITDFHEREAESSRNFVTNTRRM